MNLKRCLVAMVVLAFLLLCNGCRTENIPSLKAPKTSSKALESETESVLPSAPDSIRIQIKAMSTEQKVAQMLVAGIDGKTLGADGVSAIQAYQVGGIILFRRNVESAEQLSALTAALNRQNGDYIPLFLCIDEEGGQVSRMPPEVENIPAAFSLRGKGTDYAALGGILGSKCRAFGLNMNFAPVLDIWSNPRNTVIGNRSYGTTWEEVSEAGTAVMKGIMDKGVIPVVKHFPGHGDTEADSHHDLPVVGKSLSNLQKQELRSFKIAVNKGAPVIMVAHILLPNLDSKVPASLSPNIVTGLLREEMGFSGVVCTDDLTMGAISNMYGVGEAAVLAAEAGCDLLLVCHKAENLKAAYDALCGAVNSGRVSMQRLDESVYRILTLKSAYLSGSQTGSIPTLDQINASVRDFVSLYGE